MQDGHLFTKSVAKLSIITILMSEECFLPILEVMTFQHTMLYVQARVTESYFHSLLFHMS